MNMYLGTTKAAKELGVSTGRIRQLILRGRLKALKLGHDWLIMRRDLAAVRHRKNGRPFSKKSRKS